MKRMETFEPREVEALKQIASLEGVSYSAIVEYPESPAISRIEIVAESDFGYNVYKEGMSFNNPFVYKIKLNKCANLPDFVISKTSALFFKTAEEAKVYADWLVCELGKRYLDLLSFEQVLNEK